ncbi:twin-arginine translocase TatA/TatE family subunit [[Eubacterium] cellulosolvens]
MPFIGPWEIALILAIVLIIFGPKKLPQLAKSVGDAIKQYRDASGGNTPTEPTQPQPAQQPSQPLQYSTRESDLLLETAKKLGIQTEGKTMEQISKEITEIASKPSEQESKS